MEPFPDDLLADQHTDPEDRALRREHLTLAFLMALQHLTPVQRAILLLREVLEWEASEVAAWLNLSVPAVNSALQRARRALHQRNIGSEAPMASPRIQVQDLLDRSMTLWEQADIPGLVALLREDAWFTMPPIPTWFQGRADIATVLSTRIFIPGRQWRLLPTRANGSPAFGSRWPGGPRYGERADWKRRRLLGAVQPLVLCSPACSSFLIMYSHHRSPLCPQGMSGGRASFESTETAQRHTHS